MLLDGTRVRANVATAAVALAAAALVIAATAAGRPATVTPRCSTASASAAATAARFDVDPALGHTPINSVTCAFFFGPRTIGMAATVGVATGCGFSIGWGVFRLLQGGTWKLVMKQYNGVLKLDGIPRLNGGADIRATRGYPLPSDPRCSPSRTKSQIWHWNGSSFKASRWTLDELTATYPRNLVRFYTPDRNIDCEISDGGTQPEPGVTCLVQQPEENAVLSPSGHVTICQQQPQGQCLVNFTPGPPQFRLLPYGSSAKLGRFRCRSATTGVTCVVIATGKGFVISTQAAKPVG